ncbi:hypothetical protein BH11PSE2_BH11PSE2_06050 [soil metagenome]
MHRRSFIAASAATLLTPTFTLAKPSWKTIFTGKSLAGWTPLGDANWTLKDGVATADKGAVSYLVSKDDYADFELIAEVWVSPDANSGIFIRCEDPKVIGVATGYECNIFDTRPDPTYGTGAIVNVAKVSPMPKAGGRWNTMQITAKADTFSIVFNGVKTVDNARDAAHPKGRIALQYGAGVVKFRKVQVRTP